MCQFLDVEHVFNPYSAEVFLHELWRPKRFFQFKIIINVLVSSLRLIWIPMLWVCGHYICLSTGIAFRRQNLTSTDVKSWRLKTIPALKGFTCLMASQVREHKLRSSSPPIPQDALSGTSLYQAQPGAGVTLRLPRVVCHSGVHGKSAQTSRHLVFLESVQP